MIRCVDDGSAFCRTEYDMHYEGYEYMYVPMGLILNRIMILKFYPERYLHERKKLRSCDFEVVTLKAVAYCMLHTTNRKGENV